MHPSSTQFSEVTAFQRCGNSVPLLLVAVNLLGAALLAEIGIRAFADDGMQFDLEMWKYARDVKVISSDPLIGHEHAPNRKTKLMGVNFETNSQGLRDREFSFERTPGVLRIMMLGDSLTVGWGVNAEATFSKRLESLLNGNGTHAEVINAGAGNWNTIQEVQYFLTKGYKYRPDIIVLNYFLNDAEPVPHSRPPSFLMRHMLFLRFHHGPGRQFTAGSLNAPQLAALLSRAVR